MSPSIPPEALNRLKWRCRRGLLENDLLIERYFRRHGDAITRTQALALERLMALSDPDLLDLLLGRAAPQGDLDRPEIRAVLATMQQPH
jgi:antitoxin CptB